MAHGRLSPFSIEPLDAMALPSPHNAPLPLAPALSSNQHALQLLGGRPPHPASSTNSPPTVREFLHFLDFDEYYEVFVREGFDRMQSLIEVTEADFEAMDVKRGHRRMIQRELAILRGIPADVPLSSVPPPPGRSNSQEDVAPAVTQTNRASFHFHGAGEASSSGGRAGGSNTRGSPPAIQSEGTGKRRYRRHPKPDPTAPEKPQSAYVQFANSVREEMKGKSFTEIARIVGERWQALDRDLKEDMEAQAAAAKARYHQQLDDYRTTQEYAEYQLYLDEFKEKYGSAAAIEDPVVPKKGKTFKHEPVARAGSTSAQPPDQRTSGLRGGTAGTKVSSGEESVGITSDYDTVPAYTPATTVAGSSGGGYKVSDLLHAATNVQQQELHRQHAGAQDHAPGAHNRFSQSSERGPVNQGILMAPSPSPSGSHKRRRTGSDGYFEGTGGGPDEEDEGVLEEDDMDAEGEDAMDQEEQPHTRSRLRGGGAPTRSDARQQSSGGRLTRGQAQPNSPQLNTSSKPSTTASQQQPQHHVSSHRSTLGQPVPDWPPANLGHPQGQPPYTTGPGLLPTPPELPAA